MTSAIHTEHLCFTLTVIREYSFVYSVDNHKVYISAFNLRVGGKIIKDQITSRVQKSNMLQIRDFFFLFCNHG